MATAIRNCVLFWASLADNAPFYLRIHGAEKVNFRAASRWSLWDDRRQRYRDTDENKSAKVKAEETKAQRAKETFLQDEKNYEFGKKWLAKMMGEDFETFTEEKMKDALAYLLPSHLFAKDARPMLKHPLEVYGNPKESEVDDSGRPLDPGFYTRQPHFHHALYEIYNMRESLSSAVRDNAPPSNRDGTEVLKRWASKAEVETTFKERLEDNQYDILIYRLKKLQEHTHFNLAKDILLKFQLPVQTEVKDKVILQVDEGGIVTAMGYRKTAMAEVRVKRGTGKFTVNGQEMYTYFHDMPERHQLMYPFLVTDAFEKFDIEADTIGGGKSGQAGAIRLGISRALPSFDETYYSLLDKAGLLIRDTRQIERMKPGQRGARRKFQWVKR